MQGSPRLSLNSIDNSYSNIEKLYHVSLCKIRLMEREKEANSKNE